MNGIRTAFRSVVRTPTFAFAVVLTLALGIGLNTAIFTVVDAVFLRPFPLPEPDRLVMIQPGRLGSSHLFGHDFQMRSLESVSGYQTGPARLVSGVPARVRIAEVSGDFFRTLGAQPELGRTLTPEDELTHAPTVVISHQLWVTAFAQDPGVVGRDLELNQLSLRIVGVMPAGFRFPDDSALWIPFGIGAKDYTFGEFYFVRSFGRLAAGYSPMLAKAETDVVYQARGRHGEDSEVAFTPFPRYFKKAESEKLYLVWAAVALVLIIAVANIAHLLVLRTIGRRSELAVRLALGARLSDLLRQLLLETSMYVSLGGALGLWLAIHATRLLVSRFAIDIPPFATIGLNGRVLVFTALTSLGSALILTFVCTFVASRMRTSEWLHDQSGGLVTGRGRARARDFLVAGQLALAVLLLVCGGLTSRTLIRLHAVDLGIQADNTLSMEIWPPETPGRSFPAPQTIASYTNSLLDRMRRLPGFVSAAVTQLVPLAPGGPHRVFVIEEGGIASQLAPRQRGVFRFSVTSDYFRTMGVPLLYGSDLSDSFLPTAPCPAVIDNTFAQRFWPGQDPTGERFTSRDDHYRVVGVCTAVKKSPKLDAPLPAFYVPFAKYPPVFSSLVVRSESDANSTKQAMKEAVLAIDKSHPPSEARTITELFNQQTSSERSAALLFNGLAVLGLFLACLGVYGTVSYWVTGRRREIGVRMALGAQKGLIAWLVLKRSLIIGAAGLAGGIALALSATRYLESILWGVSPTDAVTYLTGCLILVLVVLAASYLPLRRAMGVDPAFALRHE